MDELHERLDTYADRLDGVVGGFETRALQKLLEASHMPDGGWDGAMFMRSFKPLVDEWSRRKQENQQLAAAVASSAMPRVDTGFRRNALVAE